MEGLLGVVTDVFKGTPSLIILDDCASSTEVKNRASNLVKLGFSVRHYGLSTILVAQQLTSTAKAYKNNVSTLVVFHNPNKRDLTTVINGFLGGLDSDKVNRIVRLIAGSIVKNLISQKNRL